MREITTVYKLRTQIVSVSYTHPLQKERHTSLGMAFSAKVVYAFVFLLSK